MAVVFSLNDFRNVAGDHVYQVFCGGAPITRELDNQERATHDAWDAYSRCYGPAVLQRWNNVQGVTELAHK